MRSFTDIFIKKPVLAIVINLIILAVGWRSIDALAVRQYPRLESSAILITMVYVGASAETVRGFITTPIEQAVSSTEGLDTLVSSSLQNVSTVTLKLKLNADADRAVADVLSKINQVRGAQMLIGVLDVPWLVLAGVPQGPAWGALYERGAALVVSSDTGLDALCTLLGDLCGGRTPSEGGRRELIHSWRNFAQHRGELTARVDSLTGREEEVLQQLYEGLAVRAIAERGEVTEATVRSQVKAILRKLEVNSQIAAVAAYQEVRANDAHRTAVLAGREAVDA